jgi:prevent-host-death family protein
LTEIVTKAIVMTMSLRPWSIAAAKSEFSNVVRRAARTPQVIENRGKPVAVVLGFDEFQRLRERDDKVLRWREFLRLSAELRADGGWDLELPPRDARPSPFARRKP